MLNGFTLLGYLLIAGVNRQAFANVLTCLKLNNEQTADIVILYLNPKSTVFKHFFSIAHTYSDSSMWRNYETLLNYIVIIPGEEVKRGDLRFRLYLLRIYLKM